MIDCPVCNAANKDANKVCHGCGEPLKKAKGGNWGGGSKDPDWWRCAYTTSGGERCQAAGSMTGSVTGSTTWYCSAHFRALGDAVVCDEIVRQSKPPKPKPAQTPVKPELVRRQDEPASAYRERLKAETDKSLGRLQVKMAADRATFERGPQKQGTVGSPTANPEKTPEIESEADLGLLAIKIHGLPLGGRREVYERLPADLREEVRELVYELDMADSAEEVV